MLPSVSKRTIHIWGEGEWWHRRGLWYCDFVAVQQKLTRTDLAKMPNLRPSLLAACNTHSASAS